MQEEKLDQVVLKLNIKNYNKTEFKNGKLLLKK